MSDGVRIVELQAQNVKRTAMGFALNPKFRVARIYDGSLLDEDNLKIIAEMASEHNAQVWIERVGSGAEVSVVIEDGAVLETRTQPTLELER